MIAFLCCRARQQNAGVGLSPHADLHAPAEPYPTNFYVGYPQHEKKLPTGEPNVCVVSQGEIVQIGEAMPLIRPATNKMRAPCVAEKSEPVCVPI